MKKHGKLTKSLSVTGTVLVWLPIVTPVVLSAIFFVDRGILRFDFLMPAELALLALLGGLLLLWAALRVGAHKRLITWALVLSAGNLLGSQGLAVVTGLAHGDTEPEGFWFAAVLALLGVFILGVIALGVGGILLVRDVYKPQPPTGDI